MSGSKKILFVCLGNTCRSPMAESFMRALVRKKSLDWIVDSAGLRSWNVGYYPEERCLQVLNEYGLESNHLGREILESDFYAFDYIFGMDHENLEELIDRAPDDCNANINMLGNYLGDDEECVIKDPYFCQGLEDFYTCFRQIAVSCQNFVSKELGEGKQTPQKEL